MMGARRISLRRTFIYQHHLYHLQFARFRKKGGEGIYTLINESDGVRAREEESVQLHVRMCGRGQSERETTTKQKHEMKVTDI